MRGSDIAALLRDVPFFGEVLAIDQLNSLRKGKVYVVNTKPHWHRGEHWIVIDMTGSIPFVFDSFGKPPATYGLPNNWNYSKYPLQGAKSDTCGLYCVYYITCKNDGLSLKHMMKIFGKNKSINDEKVTLWLSHYWM